MNTTDYTTILLEEYRALREESLRSSAILSNTVWVSVSGFIITVGAFANAAKDFPTIFGYLPLLLCIQAFSATSMFLSEVWKYARVGVYIREKIEKSLFQNEFTGTPEKNPLYWEHWISHKRASVYYLSVLVLLQLPVFVTIFIFGISFFEWNFSIQVSTIADGVVSDIFILISTCFVVIADIFITIYLILKIIRQNKEIIIV
ncbi:MAG: hypothetical protein D3917_06880 [Candidatus Electrothrix sp. AX5]|nr:hypothetical protein [Candidatus Electrothrix sp. AX5]